jgi:hypothetical protein
MKIAMHVKDDSRHWCMRTMTTTPKVYHHLKLVPELIFLDLYF